MQGVSDQLAPSFSPKFKKPTEAFQGVPSRSVDIAHQFVSQPYSIPQQMEWGWLARLTMHRATVSNTN